MLRCAEGGTIGEVAADLGVSRDDMVSKWRSRFLAGRLECLSDEPRPGRRLITDDRVEQMITLTLEETSGKGDSLNLHR